jgi:hypothetical protein
VAAKRLRRGRRGGTAGPSGTGNSFRT